MWSATRSPQNKTTTVNLRTLTLKQKLSDRPLYVARRGKFYLVGLKVEKRKIKKTRKNVFRPNKRKNKYRDVRILKKNWRVIALHGECCIKHTRTRAELVNAMMMKVERKCFVIDLNSKKTNNSESFRHVIIVLSFHLHLEEVFTLSCFSN